MVSDYLIEPLGAEHDRAVFCGDKVLDRYLQKQANQDVRKYSIAAPYVLFNKNSNVVIGYYTLSGTSIILRELPIIV